MIFALHADADLPVDEVGGKAQGLMRLHRAGLPVPAGEVLGCEFFSPWRDALCRLEPPTDAEAEVRRLTLDAERRALLDDLVARLDWAPGARYAVRSSAVDEDAAGHSFAGIFRSVLDVPASDIESALRECFASGFAPGVDAYRRTLGLPAATTRMAVIVQRQIDAEVAGVAFSIDPASNDHDEARIAAVRGPGSGVVDGSMPADEYVVDRVSGQTLSGPAGREGALEPTQVAALVALLDPIEALFGGPVDLEWVFAGGALHLLQARPITTWIPLPEALMTRRGEPRRLYLDAALSKGMTTNTAFSPLGLSQFERAFGGLMSCWLGDAPVRPADRRLIEFAGGRMYLDLSDLLRLATPARLARGHAATDLLTARIIGAVDAPRYRARHRPAWLRAGLLWRIPRALWRLRGLPGFLLLGLLRPQAAHRRYVATTANLLAALRGLVDDDRAPGALQAAITRAMAPHFDVLMGAMLLGLLPPPGARSAGDAAQRAALGRGVSGNVAIEMNIALQQLALRLDADDYRDPAALAERLHARRLPADALADWDAFVERFGWRGPGEMDVASARYVDSPELVVEQMRALRDADDLAASHRRMAEARDAALAALSAGLGPVRRWLHGRVRTLLDLFAGARDTPKHVNVLAGFAMRSRALRAGRDLVLCGRLDAVDDVFDLTLDELDAALLDPSLDLRARRDANLSFLRVVRRHVRSFPPVIDSRGRILRPPADARGDGILRGTPVSPGRAVGRVRVLHCARGAELEVGDVIVAYTTDPGWTPLFAKASAIVLEVGGALQHGAVVAREFGKPCIVGIAGVASTLRDGCRVEVDADAGTLRILDEPAA